ncbi:MAG TPA: energy transducer TonB [Terriglobales bacterium]|nr:energy transducer TonB [Terriglobales bacterium]
MSLRSLSRWLAAGLVLAAVCAAAQAPSSPSSQSGDQIARKIKNKVAPSYPELARRMNIAGTVKIQITVDRNGVVKNSKLVGGHPILAQAAMDAVRKWRFESGAEDTTGVVEFHFDPTQ